jgi:hypothetical protein
MFKAAGGQGHVGKTTPKTATKATLFGVVSPNLQTIEVVTPQARIYPSSTQIVHVQNNSA